MSNYWYALVDFASTHFIAISAWCVVMFEWRRGRRLLRIVEGLQGEVTRLHDRLDARESRVSKTHERVHIT
jgi:hypothetical protein